MRSSRKHRIEYGLVRVLALPMRYLPYRAALTIACGAAALSYALMPARRDTALQRIREVFGSDIPDSRARSIAWLSWRNVIFSMVDVLRFPRMTHAWLSRAMNAGEADAAIRAAMHDGKGAVLAIPHTGSWELAGAAAALLGLQLFSIAADQRNRLVTDYINMLRCSLGTDLLRRGRTNLREILRRLKKGEIFAILPDLRQRTEGIHVNFLGAEANVGAGMATFARVADVPILVGCMTRESWTRHRFNLIRTVTPDPATEKGQDIRRMTQEVLSEVDAIIRAHPEQWFWHNRRWVLEPLETNH